MTRTAFVILTCLAALLGVTANVARAGSYYYRDGTYHHRLHRGGTTMSTCCYRKVVTYVLVRKVRYVRIRPHRRRHRLHYYLPGRLSYYAAPRTAKYPRRPRRYADLNRCRRVPLRVIDARDRIVSIVVWRCE